MPPPVSRSPTRILDTGADSLTVRQGVRAPIEPGGVVPPLTRSGTCYVITNSGSGPAFRAREPGERQQLERQLDAEAELSIQQRTAQQLLDTPGPVREGVGVHAQPPRRQLPVERRGKQRFQRLPELGTAFPVAPYQLAQHFADEGVHRGTVSEQVEELELVVSADQRGRLEDRGERLCPLGL